MPRYRFGDFVVSPRRRALARRDAELALIPRYFDLLVYLIEHRHEAVHRRDIFDNVWSDVVVSDSALSQAIRTIRRTLGDDSREPRFIRTISRHGYRFVFDEVIEEEDDGLARAADVPSPLILSLSKDERSALDDLNESRDEARPSTGSGRAVDVGDPFEPLLARITESTNDDGPTSSLDS